MWNSLKELHVWRPEMESIAILIIQVVFGLPPHVTGIKWPFQLLLRE